MSDFDTFMSLDPTRAKNLAVGQWACSCGATKVRTKESRVPHSIFVRCLQCGDEAEVLAA